MPRPLTSRQLACMAVILHYQATRGYSPTLREIGRAMNIRSTNGVNDHVAALERRQCVKRDHLVARSLQVDLAALTPLERSRLLTHCSPAARTRVQPARAPRPCES